MIMTHLAAAVVKNRRSFVCNIKVIKNYLMARHFVANIPCNRAFSKRSGIFGPCCRNIKVSLWEESHCLVMLGFHFKTNIVMCFLADFASLRSIVVNSLQALDCESIHSKPWSFSMGS